MADYSRFNDGLPADLLVLIFDDLVGNHQTLSRVGLVCRSWRALSLRYLLKNINLSSHNNGRLPEREDREALDLDLRVIMSDYSDEYRPANLVPRQRAFLQFMTDRPDLSIYVKTFTWTLVWIDFGEDELTDIDMRTWDVFSRMRNITHLDLASLHSGSDGPYLRDQPYIRQNPSELFPSVTHLRLVGWMHRGLVKAILSSLDATKLVHLKLDHLQEEGAFPNGEPMPRSMVRECTGEIRVNYGHRGIDENLFARQERGDAGILPGPMWFPMRFLRQRCLSSFVHLKIRFTRFSAYNDLRNDISMFRDTAEFIRSAKDSLTTISIAMGEIPTLYSKPKNNRNRDIQYQQAWLAPRCFDRAATFLFLLLEVLNKEAFPHLSSVKLMGFRILGIIPSQILRPLDYEALSNSIHECPYIDEEFTSVPNLDYREPFRGYDLHMQEVDQEQVSKMRIYEAY